MHKFRTKKTKTKTSKQTIYKNYKNIKLKTTKAKNPIGAKINTNTNTNKKQNYTNTKNAYMKEYQTKNKKHT